MTRADAELSGGGLSVGDAEPPHEPSAPAVEAPPARCVFGLDCSHLVERGQPQVLQLRGYRLGVPGLVTLDDLVSAPDRWIGERVRRDQLIDRGQLAPKTLCGLAPEHGPHFPKTHATAPRPNAARIDQYVPLMAILAMSGPFRPIPTRHFTIQGASTIGSATTGYATSVTDV